MTDHRVRAVPVVEEGELIGQLTARSICGQIMQKRRLNIDAAEIMTSNPLFLREDAPVSKARTLMIERSIDHLPVLRGREITGILTSDMIVFRMAPTRRISLGSLVAQARRRFDVSASGLMSTDPVVSSPDTDVAQVIGAMERRRTAYSLVALWGELQGIITYRDCVKLLAEPKKETLPISIVGLPEDPFEAEATKAKFERVVKRIAKSLPDLLEARSVIKTFDKTGHRRRYEVNVELITPRRRIPFSESGWELAEIYDEISNRMKRVTTKPKQKTRRRVH
jgi:CBS domain-containing protein